MSDPVLLAYTGALTVAAGEDITLHVSSRAESFQVDVVRVLRRQGPHEVVAALGTQTGRVQALPQGSYLRVPDDAALGEESFSFEAWVKPTLLGRRQAIAARGESWSLALDGDARLELTVGGERVARLDPPLPAHRWTHVTASVHDGRASLAQTPVPEWPVGSGRARAEAEVTAAPGVGDLVIGARAATVEHFNGVIDRPTLLAADGTLVAGWRPGRESPDTTIVDVGPHGLHAEAINFPARGVPGANWSGRELDFRLSPDEFDALHFHEDDIVDARWEPTLAYRVPDDLRTGIYAFRLTGGGDEYTVAFYVVPPRGTATAKAAFLVPTMTYLAYANIHYLPPGFSLPRDHMTPQHAWAAERSVASLYDVHSDGSPAHYATHRRPMTTITPDHVDPFVGVLWNLSADLSLTDWLEHEGFEYDVITDEQLHREGLSLLERYRVVMTGTHPEYWTAPMLDAHEAYLGGGGRVMYLGGNGYYWVTGVSEAAPHVIEIRRGHSGTRTVEGEPGESVLSTTREVGGLWRHRGRPPQRHLGVGFASQGFGRGRPYDVAGPGPDGRGAFALEGVGDVIDAAGDVGGTPAGAEIDRADDSLGTPPHAVVLASATRFSDDFQHAIEEVGAANSRQGGSVEPRVRADVVFFETPHGGAVFTTGSIAWCTCLAVDDYDNAVARVTGNVLRRFLDPTPLAPPRSDT